MQEEKPQGRKGTRAIKPDKLASGQSSEENEGSEG